MTWRAGINSVLGTFALLCVLAALAAVPSAVLGGGMGVSTFQVLVAVAGLYFTVGAWRRDFWGFVGVLAICATSVVLDVLLLPAMGFQDPIRVLNAAMYATLGAALYTTRREFPRRPPARG